MIDKGYAHPLYSLHLAGPSVPVPEPGWSIAVPQGRLFVPANLHILGERTATAACQEAVARGLAQHAGAAARYARAEMDEDWAANMRFWTKEMLRRDRARADLEEEAQAHSRECLRLRQEAVATWTRLVRGARLAGLAPLLPRQRSRGEVALLSGLHEACGHLGDCRVVQALAQAGIPLEEQDRLRQLVAGLEAGQRDRAAWDRQRVTAQRELVILRGALLGDLRRLRLAGEIVLPAALGCGDLAARPGSQSRPGRPSKVARSARIIPARAP